MLGFSTLRPCFDSQILWELIFGSCTLSFQIRVPLLHSLVRLVSSGVLLQNWYRAPLHNCTSSAVEYRQQRAHMDMDVSIQAQDHGWPGRQ